MVRQIGIYGARVHGFILLLAVSTLLSCSTMRELAQTQKPRLSVKEARLTNLSFESLVLALDVRIDNPNPVGLTMAGFDYDLSLAGQSFIKGQQNRSMSIPAQGKSILEIPISLQFRELYNSFKALKNKGETPYRIGCGVTFDLPLLGRTRIPVSHSGSIPLIKLPAVKMAGLKVKNLGLSGADLELRLKLTNPNTFGLALNGIDYNLKIEGKQWAHGSRQQAVNVARGATGTVRIPISLDFKEMGMAVYRAISGKEALDYRFSGTLDLGTTLPLFGSARLPINRSGSLNILP